MLGKEDASSNGGGTAGGGSSQGPCPLSGGRKTFWRSASWSSSRTALPPLNPDSEKDSLDPNGNGKGQSRRFPVPLTPRSQCKARACLPPLQPLSIARRSLDEWPKASSDDVGEWPLPGTPGGRDANNTGERLKLDLSTIQSNPERNCGLVKREKIAFFDKECSKVAKHVYLGGDVVAKDRDILKQHGITHVLNCVGFVCPEYFKADFVYRTLWLQDSPSEDITSILYDVFDYFEDVRGQSGKVFVHCCQGVSRSTSLVIAYLMWREGQSFDDAFQYVKAARGIADPNMGFACQLLQCQKRVHAFPLSPSSLLRMYRIAPHSPYDPLHLVPKMLNNPSPAAFDSRGAFIIHTPSAIYIWIGRKCEPIMERDARGAVCQIVRYERVQGPIVMIKEGEEPLYFWDAFSSLLPLMEKSSSGLDVVDLSVKFCPGGRKVDSYNVDFEIFQKAIVGGFVPPFPSSETGHEMHLPVRESSWSMLRRKFASGNMKEFVSASKFGICRVYPDSLSIVAAENSLSKQSHSSDNLLSSSSLSPSSSSLYSPSSSSSPTYISPDSNASDLGINSNLLSDSSVVSPSVTLCINPQSSTLSSFSSLSLRSSKISSQSISKCSKFIDVNFTSKSCSQTNSSPSKQVSLSIAERRGSLSKGLKLPMLSDEFGEQGDPLSFCFNKQDVLSVNNINSPSNKPLCEEKFISNGEIYSDKRTQFQGPLGRVANDICDQVVALVQTSNEQSANDHFEEESITINVDDNSQCCNLVETEVYRWPSLEKVATFSAGDLDPKSVFIFLHTSSDTGRIDNRILYCWVGRAFDHDKSDTLLRSSQDLGDVEEIDWNEAIYNVLAQMGLPESTNIKIVKADEEPVEFLALLNSL